jgi:branched-chain amino acid aminotransferase
MRGSAPRVERAECPWDTLSDANAVLPRGGIYGAFSTVHEFRVVCLTKHLDRLEDSARRIGFHLDLDRDLVVRELGTIVRDSGFGEVKLRIGTAPGMDHLVVVLEPSPGPLVAEREHGVTCATVRHTARNNPQAKQTGWLTTRGSFSKGLTTGVFEYLLVDKHDRILEGSSSNFYAVSAIPDLRTAGEDVLVGIARSIVLEVTPAVLPVRLTPVSLAELPAMKETFLTSATRGIIPIVTIDATAVGDGTPGPVTRELMGRYDARASELEEQL